MYWARRAALGTPRVYPRFDPTSLSGLTLDLDAANPGIVLSGGKVATLPDASGGSRNFTQGTGANQPPWSATSGPVGGPGITFGGSPQYLAGPTLANVYSASQFTLVTVVKPITVVNNNAFYYSNDPIFGDQPAYASLHMRNTGTPPAVMAGVYAGAQHAQAPGLALGQWHLLVQRLTNPTLLVQRGGDAAVTAATGTIGSLAGVMRLGSVNSLYGQFVFARLLAWNRSLNSSELLSVQRGLGAQYGVGAP